MIDAVMVGICTLFYCGLKDLIDRVPWSSRCLSHPLLSLYILYKLHVSY